MLLTIASDARFELPLGISDRVCVYVALQGMWLRLLNADIFVCVCEREK